MPLLFWIEVGAYSLAAVGALAVVMVALGQDPRDRRNQLCAAFSVLGAVWCISAVMLRLLLWTERGQPAFWLELSATALNAAGVILPLFALRHTGRSSRPADLVVGVGLLATVGLAIPTFNHQFLTNPRVAPSGVVTYDLTGAGFIASAVAIPYLVWSLVVFWRDRDRASSTSLGVSVLALLVGCSVGGTLHPFLSLPVLALAAVAGVGPLVYAVASQQLLNPWKKLTADLKQEIQEQSRELTETADQLDGARAALEERSAQLQAAAHIAREAAAIHDVEQLLDETVRLISDRFAFYHAGIFLLDQAHEYVVLRAASSDGGQRMLERGHRLRVGEEGIVGYVTSSGEPRIALDVGADAVFFDNLDLPQTRSEMALPLEARGEVIGALDVQSKRPGAFRNDDVEVLQTLADQVAMAISNARLFEQAQEALEAERQAHGEFSRESWRRLLRAGRVSRSSYDPHGILSREEEWRDDMKRAAREGRPVHSVKGADGSGGAVSSETLAVPIKVRGHVIGVLDVHNSSGDRTGLGRWTPDGIALLKSMGQQLGAALETARLYQETQRQAARERLVSDVAAQMRESLDLSTVLRSGAEGIREAMGLRAVTVRLVDGDGQEGADQA